MIMRGRGTWCRLLYTSDSADDLLCVDLGGRRIIKKKNKYHVKDTPSVSLFTFFLFSRDSWIAVYF